MKTILYLTIAAIVLASGPLHAADILDLSESQRLALGIEIRAAEQAGTANARLPARVDVPPGQLRIVAAPVAGLVDRLLVVPGETVRRGQLLARLRSPQALELQRDVLQASAQATLWRQNLQRDEQLFAEGLIAEGRLQNTRAQASQAFAQQAERSRGLQLAGGKPGQIGDALDLVAPIDGVILAQGAQVGQRLEAASVIYRLAGLQPLWLEIQVPLAMAAGLRQRAPVTVVAPPLTGRLVAIGRSVDGQSQSIIVRAEVRAGAERLAPGQLVEVELGNPAAPGVTLPSAAVVRQGGAAMVFVASGSGRFAVRPVNIVGQGGSTLRVDGVRPGEAVVVRGASGLKAMLGESAGP